MTKSMPLAAGGARATWVEDLARKTVGYFPRLDDAGQRLSLAIYDELKAGNAVPVATLAASTGLPVDEVQTILDNWPGLYLDDAGCVIGYWGLTIREMGHAIHLEERTLWAWCAWDTLFLPELLDTKIVVATKDPRTRSEIKLTVTPNGIEEASGSSIIMSYLLPDSETSKSVISSFCHHIHFFESEESAAQFAAQRPEVFLMTLDEAFLLAQLKNRLQYPNLSAR